jgi:hypothetical protein
VYPSLQTVEFHSKSPQADLEKQLLIINDPFSTETKYLLFTLKLELPAEQLNTDPGAGHSSQARCPCLELNLPKGHFMHC